MNRKTVLVSMAILLVAVMAVIGCAPAAAPAKPATPSTPSAPAPAAPAQTFTFHWAYATPKATTNGAFCDLAKAAIEKDTNGRIKITDHPAGELGSNETQYIESLIAGTLDLAGINFAVMSSFTNAFEIINMPFAFKDYNQLIDYTHSDVFKAKLDTLKAKGIRMGALYASSGRGLMSVNPVTKPSDITGLKLRSMNNKMQLRSLEAMGAVVNTLPFGEVYTALQTKTIDGNNDAANMYIATKMFEAAPYFYDFHWLYNAGGTMMSTKAWDKLPADLQAIFDKDMADSGVKQSASDIKQADDAVAGFGSKYKVTYTKVSDADYSAMRKAVLPKTIPEFKDNVGMDALKWIADKDPEMKGILQSLNLY